MMMRCEEIKEILIFFVEGSLIPDKTNQVQKHLEVCHECRASYLKLKAVLSVIEKEKIHDVNPYFSMKVMERLKNKSGSHEVSANFHFIRILKPVLAVLLIGAAIYTGILLGGSYSQKYETNSMENSRNTQIQAVADEFYLNDLGIENIETILITYNK
jgi:anti-sigma factor RsiW